MKKLISLILAVIMIFSVTAVAVSAADETTKPVKITFVYDVDDGKGNGVERTKTITVNYGENFTNQAPKGSYTHAGWKYTISGWTVEGYGEAGKVWTNLPTVSEGDGITELTFTAAYDAKEVTVEGVVGDAAEDVVNGLFGESTTTFINYIIEQIKVWLGKLLLLFGTMM